ncbi:uncharacterized protein [Macrobrachium rosenbergii]|uniref:uncharacterized protein n=1 Tax=Macrobrachium rosenbergii TaxID=79674 RepID=UPI0034D6298E
MTSSFLIVSLLLVPATSELTVSDFISKSSACASDYSCEASSSTSESSVPKCRCEAECIIYGDCCYDAPTYNRAKQIQNLGKRQCIGGSYMFSTCPEEWENPDVESLCRAHSPLDIADSRDPVLHLPVTSEITNFTYSNYYCALCHSDAVNIKVWNSEMQCFFPSNKNTLEENTDILQNYLNLRKDRTTFSLRESTGEDKPLKLIKSSLKFHDERKKWLITNSNNSDIIIECSFKLAYNKVHSSNQCRPSINNCAANWTNKEVENLCLSFSAPVDYHSNYTKLDSNNGIIYAETNVEPITYRNVYCADCNYNPIESPCMVFDQKDTRGISFPIPPLTILLHVPDNIHMKNLQANANCKDNETFIPFYNTKDICILCQIIREQSTEGECIAKNYDSELQDGTVVRKSNKKNVSSQNTTLYEGGTNIYKQSESCDEFLIWNNSFMTSTHHQIMTLLTYKSLHKNSTLSQSGITHVSECLPKSSYFVLSVISLLCLTLSAISITLHLIAFLLVKSLRNLPGMNLATLCCFLLMGYIAFMTSSAKKPKTTPCYLVASAIYFCFIGSFCWMNVIAFDTWLTFRRGTTAFRSLETWKHYRIYSLVCWSLPVFAVALLIAVDKLRPPGIPESLLPKLGEYWCWFGQRLSLLLFFVVPMMISSIFILVFFIKTSRLISRHHQEQSRIPGIQRDRDLYKTNRRLAVSMGLTWVTALVAGFVENPFVWFIFILLNGLQGVFIFATFTCQKRVWENIMKICKQGNTDVNHRGTLPRRDSYLSKHQQRRMELLHVSTSYDLAHPPARVTAIYPQQAV